MSAKVVSIQQAVTNSLTAWLAKSLPRDVIIDSRWPEPSKVLPNRAITILPAGPREDDPIDPYVIAQKNIGTTGKAIYTWHMRVCRQPLQLDVWTQTDLDRDDLVGRLESALNAGDRSSIGILNSDPLRNGVTLALSDFWVGFADFYFDTPTVSDSAQATQRFEYRARYEGWAAFNLTIDATSARLATLKLKQKLHTLGALADPAAQSHIATATNAGSITYTDGT